MSLLTLLILFSAPSHAETAEQAFEAKTRAEAQYFRELKASRKTPADYQRLYQKHIQPAKTAYKKASSEQGQNNPMAKMIRNRPKLSADDPKMALKMADYVKALKKGNRGLASTQGGAPKRGIIDRAKDFLADKFGKKKKKDDKEKPAPDTIVLDGSKVPKVISFDDQSDTDSKEPQFYDYGDKDAAPGQPRVVEFGESTQ